MPIDFKNIDASKYDLVFFDCEFTGLEILKHEIVEIGLVKVKAGTMEVLAKRRIKIKPQKLENANPESLAISGYNEEEWADAVESKTGLEEFLSYTDGCMLVGHNVAVDRMFLQKALEDCGLEPNFFYKALDTFSLAWAKLQGKSEFKSFSLSELAPYFSIDEGAKHRALDDAKTTYQVFKKLMEL